MHRSARFLDLLFRTSATLGALALIAIALLVTADVLTRWISGRPIVGVFEITTVLLVAVTFLPLALVLLRNQLIRVDILAEHVRGRAGAGLALIDALIGLIVFGLLAHYVAEEFRTAYQGSFMQRGMIEIPTTVPICALLVGVCLTVLASLYRATRTLIELFSGDSRQRHDPSRSEQG